MAFEVFVGVGMRLRVCVCVRVRTVLCNLNSRDDFN